MQSQSIIYCRRSSLSGDNRNLKTQQEDCERYATSHGLSVTDVIAHNFTGTAHLRERHPALWQEIESGKVRSLIVASVDRLSRASTVEALSLIAELRRIGCVVHSADVGKVLDPDDITTILGSWMSSQERARLVGRMYENKKRKAAAQWVGAGNIVPFGYSKTGTGKTAQLQIDEHDAALVRRMFAMYASGTVSQKEIADRLNAEHVKAPRGGLWRESTVRKILMRRLYIGVVSWGGVEYMDKRLEIITPAQFEMVQQRFKVNIKLSKRNTKRDYLLRGRIYCYCGKHMSLVYDGHLSYRCNDATRQPFGKRCMSRVSAPLIDAAAVDYIRWAVTDEVLTLGLEENKRRDAEQLQSVPERIKRIDADIAARRKNIKRLMGAFGESDTDALDQISEDRAVIASLQAERDKLTNAELSAQVNAEARGAVMLAVRQYRYMLDNPTPGLLLDLATVIDLRLDFAKNGGIRSAILSSNIAPKRVYPL